MQNLARVILVIVAVFVLAVTATLVVRSRTTRAALPEPPASRADLQIKEVDLEEEARGVRWRLKAEQALMFEKTGLTQLSVVASGPSPVASELQSQTSTTGRFVLVGPASSSPAWATWTSGANVSRCVFTNRNVPVGRVTSAATQPRGTTIVPNTGLGNSSATA
jgi:hypothetical protein